MKIRYARVSTKDQFLSMQIDALKKAGCDQIHEEIMRNIRESDILVIWKLDRLGRT